MVGGDTRNVWDGGQQYGEDGWPQLPSRETNVGWKHGSFQSSATAWGWVHFGGNIS